MSPALSIYLSDHLAGSVGAINLLARLARLCDQAPIGARLRELLVDIEADRRVLESLMDQLEVARHPLKQRAMSAVERLLKLRQRATPGIHPMLELFQGLEFLVMGITGKLSLWRALREVAGDYPPVAALHLAALERRAEEQLQKVESYRLAAAGSAIGAAAPSP